MPEHESRVAQRRERNPPDALGEVVRRLGGGLEREPGLAGAAGAGEGEQADAVPEPLDHLVELALAAEELGRRDREVGAVQRPRLRELARPELEQPLRRGEVLEAVLAQVADLEGLVEQVAGRRARRRLPAVAAAMIRAARWTSIPTYLGGSRIGSPVWTPARTPDGPSSSAASASPHRAHRFGRRREGVEEPVARGVDLVAAVTVERPPQGAPVLGERVAVLLRPEASRSLVDPSMSVKTSVTVPDGCSRRHTANYLRPAMLAP